MNKTQLLQSLKQKGFSEQILNAFESVKREDFIPQELKSNAYEDIPLPIGKGQTISQPYTIAMMLSLLSLQKSQKVLEIGSGCGYVLALISKIVGDNGKIFGIEIIKELAEKSKENLKNFKNIKVFSKSGMFGLKEKSPFSNILISAACEKIPDSLASQLKNKGIIVAPVGPKYEQSLIAYQKINNKLIIQKQIPGFIFVPFV